VNLASPQRRHKKVLSGSSSRRLSLVERHSPPRRKLDYEPLARIQGESDLFDDNSSVMSGNAFGTGPGDNAATPGVPGAQQNEGVNFVEPKLIGGQFDQVLNNGDAKSLHNLITNYMSQFDALTFVQNIKYQGFNRDEFIREALKRITPHQMLRLGLIGAIRGANFEKILKSSGAVDTDLAQLGVSKVIQRTAKRSSDITILRCTSAIPQWCAHYMAKAGVVKKVPASECPSWLQFPAAASLPMSSNNRIAHVRFSIAFSKIIGGVFNENIYMAMFNNQLDMSEIPDELKISLGISTREESLAVDVATIIASEIQSRGR